MNIEKRYYLNTKFLNMIKNISSETIDVVTIPNKGIVTTVSISGIQDEITITEFDKCIVDAIFTLYSLGFNEFTFIDLIKTMIIGKVDKLSQKQIDSIQRSIDKLRHIELSIDATNEMIAYKKIEKDDKYILSGLMLPVKLVKVKSANNKYVDGYHFVGESVLFQYATKIKQIICINCKYISIKLRYSEDNVTLLNYMIKRIGRYQNENNHLLSNRIMLDRYDTKSKTNKGLYYDLGYLDKNGIPPIETWREKKMRINKTIIKILDQFCENGFIKSYVRIKGINKSISGYELIFSK